MEGIGSYISVIGLSALFASDPVIMVMSIILDIAKIAAISFLYQNWSEINRVMKYYMVCAVMVLMSITSAGAFGYLSGAVQVALQPNKEVTLRVESLSRQQADLEKEREELQALKLNINQQIANVPVENQRARRQLIASYKPELERVNSRLSVVNTQLDTVRIDAVKVKSENIEKEVHTGPILFVANTFGISVETASTILILIIIAVFDPLAVVCVLASNFLYARRSYKKPDTNEPPKIEDSLPESLPVFKVETVETIPAETTKKVRKPRKPKQSQEPSVETVSEELPKEQETSESKKVKKSLPVEAITQSMVIR